MTRRTYDEVLRLADEILAAGWPVVLDGAFGTVAERDEARTVARRHGLAHALLWCDAPDPVIAERLRRRAADPAEVSDGRVELLAAHRTRFEPPGSEADAVRIDTTTDPEPQLGRALRGLEGAR